MSTYTPLEQIILTLRRRNYEEADRILSEARQDPSFDIDKKNIAGLSIVHMFATPDRVDELKWLKAAGADFNVPDNNGHTPLMAAVMSASAPAVKALLDAGADPSITNSRGVAPLMQAVLNYHENGITKLLLEAGAPPDPVAETGTTPLLAAASRGRAEIVASLLDAGADPEVADFQGIGLLTSAVLSHGEGDGCKAVLEVIKNRAIPLDPNAPAKSGTTPMAAAIGQLDALSMLMDMGGDVSVKQSNRFNDGVSLLASVVSQSEPDIPMKEPDAANSGNLNPMIGNGIGITASAPAPEESEEFVLTQKMLERGASPMARSDNGQNVAAAALGSATFLKVLVDNGLDPTRPVNVDGALPWDALLHVAGSGKLDVEKAKDWISRVHKLGFGFERPQWDENVDGPKPPPPLLSPGEKLPTPLPVLHRFVAAEQYDLAWHCIAEGANPDVRNEAGESLAHVLVRSASGLSRAERQAISLASRARNMDQAETDKQIKEIKLGAEKRLDELRRAATRAGIHWDATDANGNTPLHLAAQLGNNEWTRWLIVNAGVGMELRNESGLTAAGSALLAGHAETAYALVKVAEDRRKDLRTALLVDTILASPDEGRMRGGWLNAVEALKGPLNWTDVDLQASPRDAENRHPVFLAAATEMDDVSRILLRLGADPNARDAAGNTAIMAAAFNENGEIIRQLRAMGCDMTAKNDAGQTVDDVARWTKSLYLHKVLEGDSGLDEIRQEIMGKDRTEQEHAELVEDQAWFQSYLDKLVDYYFQKATQQDLADIQWARPMSVRAREAAEKRQAEQLAKLAQAQAELAQINSELDAQEAQANPTAPTADQVDAKTTGRKTSP